MADQKEAEAEKQLQAFIDKFEPGHRSLIRDARRQLQERFPTACELVYDNYNFFVIGYSPTERPLDSVVSIAAAANGVGLCFIRGASLPDPQKVLLGSGKQTRFVRLDAPGVIARPVVAASLDAAADAGKALFAPEGRGGLIIRSVSAKQKPRRKTAKVTGKGTRKATTPPKASAKGGTPRKERKRQANPNGKK